MATNAKAGNTALGNEMRRIREELGWSQGDLAVQVGWAVGSQGEISKYEAGKQNPDRDTVDRIATAFEAAGQDASNLRRLAGVAFGDDPYRRGMTAAVARMRDVLTELEEAAATPPVPRRYLGKRVAQESPKRRRPRPEDDEQDEQRKSDAG